MRRPFEAAGASPAEIGGCSEVVLARLTALRTAVTAQAASVVAPLARVTNAVMGAVQASPAYVRRFVRDASRCNRPHFLGVNQQVLQGRRKGDHLTRLEGRADRLHERAGRGRA